MPEFPVRDEDRAQSPHAEQLADNADWIRRASAALFRRYNLGEDDAQEFASWVCERLTDDGYAILRRFRGESSLRTYLTVVLSSLFRDYRAREWGRWRPSAAACRLGPLAIRLERLVHRDGMSLAQASEVLRESADVGPANRALAELLAQLPPRAPLRPAQVSLDDVASSLSAGEPVDFAEADEARSLRENVDRALVRAVDNLPAEDRILVRLRFWEGLTIAQAARALGVPQKPLYRRFERALDTMRHELERAGISREQARARLAALVRAVEPDGESAPRAHPIEQHRRTASGGA